MAATGRKQRTLNDRPTRLHPDGVRQPVSVDADDNVGLGDDVHLVPFREKFQLGDVEVDVWERPDGRNERVVRFGRQATLGCTLSSKIRKRSQSNLRKIEEEEERERTG